MSKIIYSKPRIIYTGWKTKNKKLITSKRPYRLKLDITLPKGKHTRFNVLEKKNRKTRLQHWKCANLSDVSPQRWLSLYFFWPRFFFFFCQFWDTGLHLTSAKTLHFTLQPKRAKIARLKVENAVRSFTGNNFSGDQDIRISPVRLGIQLCYSKNPTWLKYWLKAQHVKMKNAYMPSEPHTFVLHLLPSQVKGVRFSQLFNAREGDKLEKRAVPTLSLLYSAVVVVMATKKCTFFWLYSPSLPIPMLLENAFCQFVLNIPSVNM